MRLPADPGCCHVGFVEAGEERYADHPAMFTRRSFGILHHRLPAAGVNGNDRGFEYVDCLHRAGNGVGDIVQLEVEEDRQTEFVDFMHPVVTVGEEEFQP